jgi:protocatechuate 4,5-dioxygenase alpha subunit
MRPLAAGLSPQHVLHVADEGREPQGLQGERAGVSQDIHLTPAQTEAILKREYNRMLELGGNIYFTAKLGATDGHSFRHLAAVMTGSTQDDYAAMMLAGGRSAEGNRSKSGRKTTSLLVGGAKEKSGKAKSSKPKSKSRSKSRSKRG